MMLVILFHLRVAVRFDFGSVLCMLVVTPEPYFLFGFTLSKTRAQLSSPLAAPSTLACLSSAQLSSAYALVTVENQPENWTLNEP